MVLKNPTGFYAHFRTNLKFLTEIGERWKYSIS